MKVLITNGSDFKTWYYQQQGSLWNVTSINKTHYNLPDEVGRWSAGVRKEDGLLLYTEAEYEKITAGIAEHGRTIVELQQELIEVREGEKVEVPQEVADAIQSFRDEGHDLDYIIANLALDIQKPTSRLQTLKTYAYKYGYTLIAALINGYTIEQSPAEKLIEGIKNICDEFDVTNRDNIGYDDISSLAFRVADFVESNIKS